jgi:hypothetical protein
VSASTKVRGWKRHLDGWQAGAILVVIAGSAILLGIPRSVRPERPPAPQLDVGAILATMKADDRQALSAEAIELDVDVRAVGRELRAYNLAAASKDELSVQDARRRLLEVSRTALARSTEQLLMLRAYQMKRFISELEGWQNDGSESDELRALGGDFVSTLARNRWCSSGRRLLLSTRELRILFKKRWNDITGLHGPSFDLTRDENLARFAFLLRHPFRRGDLAGLPRRAAAQRSSAQLQVIEKLAAIDTAYPVDLARGVVFFRNGLYTRAGERFRRHLAAHPDGAHTLRARNYLKAALELSLTEPI